MSSIGLQVRSRTVFENMLVGLSGAVAIASVLMYLCTIAMPFVVSKAYAEQTSQYALYAAGLSAILGMVSARTERGGSRPASGIWGALVMGFLGYLSVSHGLPDALGLFSGQQQTVTFEVTELRSASKNSCGGAIISHPDYEPTKICTSYAQVGMHVIIDGSASWYGLRYGNYQLVD